jgi:hypothetical protein
LGTSARRAVYQGMAVGTAALVALAAASGNFQMPVVAGDRAAGLSADGSTAVLAENPASGRTRFAVIDRRDRRLDRVITLRGNFGFDATSPDGSKLFVIRYLSADRRRYAVQSLSTSDADPSLRTVVEKGEPGEKMAGLPVSRVSSGDGGWVYTLYDGAEGEPFIHALDTDDQFTVCIDLDALKGRHDLAALRMSLDDDGQTIVIADARRTPLLNVKTGSFDVTEVAQPNRRPVTNTAPRAKAETNAGTADGPPWLLIGGLAGAALLATGAARRRGHRDSPSVPGA